MINTQSNIQYWNTVVILWWAILLKLWRKLNKIHLHNVMILSLIFFFHKNTQKYSNFLWRTSTCRKRKKITWILSPLFWFWGKQLVNEIHSLRTFAMNYALIMLSQCLYTLGSKLLAIAFYATFVLSFAAPFTHTHSPFLLSVRNGVKPITPACVLYIYMCVCVCTVIAIANFNINWIFVALESTVLKWMLL